MSAATCSALPAAAARYASSSSASSAFSARARAVFAGNPASRRRLAPPQHKNGGRCPGASPGAAGAVVVVPTTRAVIAPAPERSVVPARSDAELRAEEALLAGDDSTGTIAGFTKREWSCIQTPARYLGNEFGAMHKDWDSAEVRFTMAYPEIYEVGASNLGHVVLYTILNRQEGMLCDRSYLPGDDMCELLKAKDRRLFAVESKRPLAHFDAVGMSLAYELGAVNLLEMMHLSGIPITAKERDDTPTETWDVDNGSWPLIFIGGPTATSNPEPVADFVDFVCIGDGEDIMPEIGECLKRCKREKLNREETLFRLATEVDGVYAPRFYDSPPGWGGAVFPIREGVPPRIRRRVSTPDPMAQIGLVPYVSTVHDRLTVEIRRGCTRGCRFCQPGMLTRPARDVEPEIVIAAVEKGMRDTGYNEFSLLSLSCSDYLALPAVGLMIKNKLKDDNVTLSLPSQRIDRFDDSIANILGGAGKTGLTFAPEAGTQRLRDIINKGLTNDELLNGVQTAYDRGWRNVKLYFMVGLPGETDADVLGIAETVQWLIKTVAGKKNKKKDELTLTLTLSNFTPKPHTPFQWHSVSTDEFERKGELLKQAIKKVKGVKANFTSVRISAMEDFIGRGDRALCDVIRRSWELGAHKDTWWDGQDSSFKAFDQAIEEAGLTWKYRQTADGEWDVLAKLGDAAYRGQGEGGKGRIDRGALSDERLDAPLPWDHIDTGIEKWWLKADLQKALEGITVPDCSHSGICTECGVCGDEFGENVVAEVPPIPVFGGQYQPDGRKAQRLRFRFTKDGKESFIGHLDTLRLLERAARRAALPVSMTRSPFSSRPRISTAMALSLGASSECEMMEIILTERRDPEEVRASLSNQLPAGMRITEVEELDINYLNGKVLETMNDLLTSAEFLVHVAVPGAVARPGVSSGVGEAPSWDVEGGGAYFDAGKNGDGIPDADVSADEEEDAEEAATAAAAFAAEAEAAANVTPEDWRRWVAATLAKTSYKITKKSKKGNSRQVDLRPQLLELEYLDQDAVTAALAGKQVPIPPTLQPGTALLRFKGEYTGAGGLSVEGMAKVLGSGAGGMEMQVLHAHRTAIHLSANKPPGVDAETKLWLDNMCRAEAFMAIERQWEPVKGTNNRGHMGGDEKHNRIDNHRDYRKD
mmetsp:Transcript_11804/g.28601  ORF Transcript_11804/g.28601 Transcript_11804/m.28601 type:complete len:1155 (-) Transcript_11804:126-3590(-)